MIKVMVYGADEFLCKDIEAMMLPQIAKIYSVKNEEVFFLGMHSAIYHGGVDQTSFHAIFKIECDEKYKEKEEEAAKYVLKASELYSVHCHLEFNYVNSKTYQRINEEYPLFVTKSNQVVVEEDEDYDEEEVFTGNIFESFDTNK